MSDQDVTVVQESPSNTGKWLLLLLALIYVGTSLYFRSTCAAASRNWPMMTLPPTKRLAT